MNQIITPNMATQRNTDLNGDFFAVNRPCRLLYANCTFFTSGHTGHDHFFQAYDGYTSALDENASPIFSIYISPNEVGSFVEWSAPASCMVGITIQNDLFLCVSEHPTSYGTISGSSHEINFMTLFL